MTIRAKSAILSTIAAAAFLTCAAWPGYAKAGSGQGTQLGVNTAYYAAGPGQGTVLVS